MFVKLPSLIHMDVTIEASTVTWTVLVEKILEPIERGTFGFLAATKEVSGEMIFQEDPSCFAVQSNKIFPTIIF